MNLNDMRVSSPSNSALDVIAPTRIL